MSHDAAHAGHDHDKGHSHEVSADADRRWLSVALALIAAFMLVEVAVGVLSRSLALISDSAHMLTDAAALVLALVAIRLAARPARGHFTFGLKRAEILSAQVNGVSLLVLGGVIAYEAISRLVSPVGVHGWTMVVTAAVGVVVNVAATWAISRANRASLNIEGAFQHILNDLYAFVATALAGLVIIFTGFERADPIASLVVVFLMAKAGVRLLRDSAWVRARRRSPRMCWCLREWTVTRFGCAWTTWSVTSSVFTTRPCRWITWDQSTEPRGSSRTQPIARTRTARLTAAVRTSTRACVWGRTHSYGPTRGACRVSSRTPGRSPAVPW
jgi:Co/Zn/Cd efflux system component